MSTAQPQRSTWMALDHAGKYYDIPVGTLRYWIKMKLLNANGGLHKVGGRYRLNTDEFETKFMDSAGLKPRTPKKGKKSAAPPADFSDLAASDEPIVPLRLAK